MISIIKQEIQKLNKGRKKGTVSGENSPSNGFKAPPILTKEWREINVIKINSNLAILIMIVGVWISFLSIEWKIILSSGAFMYLFSLWDVYIVEEFPNKFDKKRRRLQVK